MNSDLIQEARELCAAATPGPWGSRIDVGKTYYVFTPSYGVRDFCCLSGGFEHESDAAFIARSRTLVEKLCDALEKAEERGQSCEHCQGWDTRSGANYCPMCGKRLEEHHEAN